MMLEHTTDDLRWFSAYLSDYLSALPEDAWTRPTGDRPQDWTLTELMAHLASIAEIFNQATEAALGNRPLVLEGLQERRDLRHWNAAQIAARQGIPGLQLLSVWRAQIAAAADRAATLSPAQAEATAFLPVYNRPARVIDFIDWQLSHAGIIHGAQVTRAMGDPPLWMGYPPDFTVRQIDRFMRHLSAAYWHDLAGAEDQITLAFEIEGAGEWHILAA
ncbi:MAG: maleylpyruvate isomerase N-terminal domain-containing protein, partial [Anaerolineales bacterium]